VQMSFYISNSDAKKNVILVLVVILFSMVLLDIALAYYMIHKTNKNVYKDEITSKSKHLKLNALYRNIDIVFIGSSRTLCHISTATFNKQGLDAYNYGVSQRTITNYAFMAEQALKVEPKLVAMSIDISALFSDISKCDFLLFDDVKALFATKQDLKLIFKSIIQTVGNMNSIHRYREPLNLRIKKNYKKFDRHKQETSDNLQKSSPIFDINSLRQKVDCEVFDFDVFEHNVLAKCTNGDMILFGNKISITNNKKSIKFEEINKEYIDLLNYIINNIKRQNVIPIIILQPILHNPYIYDYSYIATKIDADVVDLTNLKIRDDFWANNVHLNNDGRLFYTKQLILKLKPLVEKNS
jgi:hypothetical protein